MREAFRDPQTYFFFFVTISNAIPTGGVNTFGNLVFGEQPNLAGGSPYGYSMIFPHTVSLGFTPLQTLVEGTLPQNVLGVLWFFAAGVVITKFRHARCTLFPFPFVHSLTDARLKSTGSCLA